MAQNEQQQKNKCFWVLLGLSILLLFHTFDVYQYDGKLTFRSFFTRPPGFTLKVPVFS